MDDHQEPVFASSEEEARHYRHECKALREELDEYRSASAELERELEAELNQKEASIRELNRHCEHLDKALHQTKERLALVTNEANNTISTLEGDLGVLKASHRELLISLRCLEQRHDDVERSERVYQSSLSDVETKLEGAVERNAFLEYENNALEIELQHLREELRDTQAELAVIKNQSQPPTPQPLKLERQSTANDPPPTLAMLGWGGEEANEDERREANRSERANGRTKSNNALGLVNDILLRVMSLEKRLSTCRSFIRPRRLPNGLDDPIPEAVQPIRGGHSDTTSSPIGRSDNIDAHSQTGALESKGALSMESGPMMAHARHSTSALNGVLSGVNIAHE